MIFPVYKEEIRYYPGVDKSAIPLVKQDLEQELDIIIVSINTYESDIMENPCVKAVILKKISP